VSTRSAGLNGDQPDDETDGMLQFATMVHWVTTESLDVFQQRLQVSTVSPRRVNTLLTLSR
jgi:hypothetical protein